MRIHQLPAVFRAQVWSRCHQSHIVAARPSAPVGMAEKIAGVRAIHTSRTRLLPNLERHHGGDDRMWSPEMGTVEQHKKSQAKQERPRQSQSKQSQSRQPQPKQTPSKQVQNKQTSSKTPQSRPPQPQHRQAQLRQAQPKLAQWKLPRSQQDQSANQTKAKSRRDASDESLGKAPSGVRSAGASSYANAIEEVDSVEDTSMFQTLDEVLSSNTMPTMAEYQTHRPSDGLFVPTRMQMTLERKIKSINLVNHTAHCSIRTRKSKTQRPGRADPANVLGVKLKFELRDRETKNVILEEMTYGAGETHAQRQTAAWAGLVAKLHASGMLHMLFRRERKENVAVLSQIPSLTEQKSQQPTMTVENVVGNHEALQINESAVDDIYNFAASMGTTPQFSHARLSKELRVSLMRRGALMPRTAICFTLELPGLGFSVTTVGSELRIISIMAFAAIKQKIEAAADKVVALRETLPDRSVINLASAPQFFEFLRLVKSPIKVDFDAESNIKGKLHNNQVIVRIDGEVVGTPSQGQSAKEAMTFAQLFATLEVIKKDPKLYDEFAVALEKDGGQILRRVSPVQTELSYELVAVMQSALVEAKGLGLSDKRRALPLADVSTADARRRRQYLMPSERSEISQRLKNELEAFEQDPAFSGVREARATLPMDQYKDQVLDTVSKGTYSIVVGATGSGKTTQVPQIILDDAIRRGEGGNVDIICTQPRRIAATSVARRVADERGQALQQSVGYQVRFDMKAPKQGGSITYCTTGILLQIIKNDPDGLFDTVSHLVLDEVHERDMDVDFLLINLKRAVQERRKAGKSVPKVVLMSATMDTELFRDYFAKENEGECLSLSVPGRMFPVKETYLPEIMETIKKSHSSELQKLINLDSKNIQEFLAAEQDCAALSSSPDDQDNSVNSIDWKGLQSVPGSLNVREDKTEAYVPVPLVAATIAHVAETTDEGAILVFLPGLQEITSTEKLLRQSHLFGVNFNDAQKYSLHILHSSTPPEDQKRVFDKTPEGCRKIILSTNIAETSVTVPDVKHVIDSGKLREKRYDQMRRITKLDCVWGSKSNLKQRAGRAGRVSNGHYYAIYSQERKGSMRATVVPELLRSDLSEVCLAIKAQGFKEPSASFLEMALEPPAPAAVNAAVDFLKAMQAFTDDEELTVLGRVLAKIPVHPTLGKMILLGIVFKCLDPLLLLGSMDAERSFFVFPPTVPKRQIRELHKKYTGDHSDQLAALKAVEEMREIDSFSNQSQVWQYAKDNFLHFGQFRDIMQTARQITQILHEIGLVPKTHERGDVLGGPELNVNSSNKELVKCLALAGLHPNLAVKLGGRMHRTPREDKAVFPQSSENLGSHDDGLGPGTMYTYSSLYNSQDGQMIMRGSTLISPMMALLFGGKLTLNDKFMPEMDGWIPFWIAAASRGGMATKTLLEYRKALDRMINQSLVTMLSNQQAPSDRMTTRFSQSVLEVLKCQHPYLPGADDRDRSRGARYPAGTGFSSSFRGGSPNAFASSRQDDVRRGSPNGFASSRQDDVRRGRAPRDRASHAPSTVLQDIFRSS